MVKDKKVKTFLDKSLVVLKVFFAFSTNLSICAFIQFINTFYISPVVNFLISLPKFFDKFVSFKFFSI